MYNNYRMYSYPYCGQIPMCNLDSMYNTYQYPCFANTTMYDPAFSRYFADEDISLKDELDTVSEFDSLESFDDDRLARMKDYGPQPFVININEASKQNKTFRTALWTGKHLQVTLMSINVGDDIGLEIHPNIDQFIRIEEGQGIVRMGKSKGTLDFQARVYDDSAIMIPAGTWHNVINTGNKPLKVYAIYAPPQHPHGTVHVTKEDAEANEKNHH
ncbi:cupin domain-containing protein [Clostridium magnum]|uniref:Cupin domain protein n=1 Tax=Clostridium magnum DSM 2767 TaxID=1121326 RepID=A0A161XCF2_9CLOT|nr:cupin domain-containing protein [Clostridium magnum]KZL91986.1 cupin domain protein [Clostridium magnum DSM 2767]SHH27131.1 Mannose-6-phosphate isomerase, cupin superfamily [Clostridium magnum DSM 2767]